MGGGAGINFSLTITGGYCLWHPKKRVFEIAEAPTIEKFDMLDYMTGMRDVRGELLPISDFAIQPLDQEDADFIRNRWGIRANQRLWFNQRGTIEKMIWGGYVRGDIRETAPGLDFSFDVQIEGCQAIAGFRIQPTEEFFEFYQDVFENWCENTEDDMDNYATTYQKS